MDPSSISLFGSCRINLIKNNKINSVLGYAHSTKEILQQINVLLGNIVLPETVGRYAFSTSIIGRKPFHISDDIIKAFIESTVCIVEICSLKTYLYNNYYLNHLAIDKRAGMFFMHTPKELRDWYKCIKMGPDEIERDILEIRRLIKPRRLILVTHYNAKLYGKHLLARDLLINLIVDLAKKHNISVINPLDVLGEYTQEQVMLRDLAHYTQFGMAKMAIYMAAFLVRECPIDRSE
jgi:hypothetical protein